MTACDGSMTGHGARPRAAADAILMVVDGPIRGTDIPGLCARARRLLAGGADVLVCDVASLAEPDLGTVDALARLRLTAARLGRRLRLRAPSTKLRGLLAFTGLADLFPACPEGGASRSNEQARTG